MRSSGETYSAVPTKEFAREEVSSLESCGVAAGLSFGLGRSRSFAVPKSVIFIRMLASRRILLLTRETGQEITFRVLDLDG